MTTPSTATFTAAADHAGRWKAGCGRAPHFSGAHREWSTCLACPLDGCSWHHDEPHGAVPAPDVVEALVREHVAAHDLADVLASLLTARDATAAVRASNDRAWDVVQLHRLRAVQRGEGPHTDPVAQMLSAALVGTDEHQAVREELDALQPQAPAGTA
ncbi:MAG TPA: hypothetical protein VFH94_08845 [Streptomyces sp.]|nr:hypothetical protein [Streptomyces sp.]